MNPEYWKFKKVNENEWYYRPTKTYRDAYEIFNTNKEEDEEDEDDEEDKIIYINYTNLEVTKIVNIYNKIIYTKK